MVIVNWINPIVLNRVRMYPGEDDLHTLVGHKFNLRRVRSLSIATPIAGSQLVEWNFVLIYPFPSHCHKLIFNTALSSFPGLILTLKTTNSQGNRTTPLKEAGVHVFTSLPLTLTNTVEPG